MSIETKEEEEEEEEEEEALPFLFYYCQRD